jgi:GNAT superfamily N-acetyltransferase
VNVPRLATSDADIARCFAVMQQLRPHLVESEFVGVIRHQETTGFLLALLEDAGGTVRAVAGYRYLDNLASGHVLYVDDLVTDAESRSAGFGKVMFDWLVGQARIAQCQCLTLDSGVQRFDAHRFYLTNRMIISSHHFRLAL